MTGEKDPSYYAVASIDVLGITEDCEGLEELPTDAESLARFEKAYEETVSWIETFRNCFRELFDFFVGEQESIAKVPGEEKSKFDELRKVELKYHFISDTVFAFVPLATTGFHANVVNGIYGIIGACGGMLLGSLAEGKPFRAGIDVGVGIELKNGDLFGPAAIKASEIEKRIANYPRIVFGDNFLGYLDCLIKKNNPTLGKDEDDREACKIMADCCLRMTDIDIDGHRIVDYLGKEFRTRLYNFREKHGKGSFEEVYRKARQFVASEYIRRSIAKDELATRYFLLNRYFESREEAVV